MEYRRGRISREYRLRERILPDANALSAALKWGRTNLDCVSAKCDLVEFRFNV